MDIKRAPKKKTGRYVAIGAGILGLVLVTVALSKLKPAAPTVERSGLWFGKVERGPMVRQVRGPGTLVPEQIRYVTAIVSGRVERVYVRPGDRVAAGTVIVDLVSPDEQLQFLTSQQSLAGAQANLVTLRTQLEQGRLSQLAAVTQVRTQLRDAQRNYSGADSMLARNLIAANEAARLRDLVQDLTERVSLEEQRLAVMQSTMDSQLTLQREQVQREREVTEFRRQRLAALHVTSGVDGIIQNLTLQPGQFVQSGTELARVLQPGRLKAELRIPETQARDVSIGQSVSIDTRIGEVPGKIIRIDPNSSNGTVTVESSLEGPLPQGARPDLSVEGTIEIDRLPESTLSVGRPAFGQQNSPVGIFKVEPNTGYANRTNVRLGRGSVSAFEILDGLIEGDSVILSDMSRWDNVDRVRIR